MQLAVAKELSVDGVPLGVSGGILNHHGLDEFGGDGAKDLGTNDTVHACPIEEVEAE